MATTAAAMATTAAAVTTSTTMPTSVAFLTIGTVGTHVALVALTAAVALKVVFYFCLQINHPVWVDVEWWTQTDVQVQFFCDGGVVGVGVQSLLFIYLLLVLEFVVQWYGKVNFFIFAFQAILFLVFTHFGGVHEWLVGLLVFVRQGGQCDWLCLWFVHLLGQEVYIASWTVQRLVLIQIQLI